MANTGWAEANEETLAKVLAVYQKAVTYVQNEAARET